MFTITISVPLAITLALAALIHIGGILAAFAILSFVAMRYRAKRTELPLDPYEGYEPSQEELDQMVELNCPWACGECYYCKLGREPDEG